MQTFMRRIIISLLVAGFGLLIQSSVQAQPVLNFKRVINNWPIVDLYFTVACNGQPEYTFNKYQNFRVVENDIEINDFTLWCPDPSNPCQISVSLVFDASGSMNGAGNAGAKAAGNAFVDKLDGVIDEAAVIWFTSVVTVRLGMTSNLTDLHTAINSLPSSGATAVWDGIYTGLLEVIANASNPCRAVIAMTDGGDNASTKTPQDIISLANKNRIRVFTVGLGGVTPAQLETIALLTGGKYYQAPSANQLITIYEEIFTILRGGFFECYITYESTCMDGGLRLVDLTLQNFCNGDDTKTKTFRAPKDTSTYTDVDIELGDFRGLAGTEFSVPLVLTSPITGLTNWEPATFTMAFDSSCVTFEGLDTPPGTILNGIPTNIDPIPGGVSITTTQRVQIASSDTLAFVRFKTRCNPADSASYTLDLATWVFVAGCFKPVLHDGTAKIYNSEVPVIQIDGNPIICEGDNVRLSAEAGFRSYLWSTGDTTRSIIVHTQGSYWVEVENHLGLIERSELTHITVLPSPEPGIMPAGPVSFCKGGAAPLFAEQGFAAYRWSTGDTTTSISVSVAGFYYVDVLGPNGCWGRSDTIVASTKPTPSIQIQGPQGICDSSSTFRYFVSNVTGDSYSWTIAGGTITTPANRNSIDVKWGNGPVGTITLTQTNTGSGCSATDSIQVGIATAKPSINYSGDLFICRGDSLILIVDPDYPLKKWSTGEESKFIVVKESGSYFCEVGTTECSFITDTVRLTVIDSLAPYIKGPDSICAWSTAQYTTQDIPGAQYFWKGIGGSVIAGQGTHTAIISWGNNTQGSIQVVVIKEGSCSGTGNRNFAVVPVARPLITPSGIVEICPGDTTTLQAPAGFTQYLWSTGDTTKSIDVTAPGTYKLTAVGINGCLAPSDTVEIILATTPATPDIIQVGNVLTCSVTGQSYRWYKDGSLLPNETQQSIVITEAGDYMVTVISSAGCESTSATQSAVGIDRFAPTLARQFDISPNPNNGLFDVVVEFETATAFSIKIVDLSGKTIYRKIEAASHTTYRRSISLQDAAPGVYFFLLESRGVYDYRKIVVR
jgi:von Willebrand factor type A domain-containing protein/PKD domain-containing protein/type IX secretion system substrate protein